MMTVLKRFASLLPERYQQALKRLRFGRQVRRGTFETHEPEFARLGRWVREGDWVIDIGANIGHYSVRLSDLVGENGRVIAFEPVPYSFELLSANMEKCRHKNLTLLNAAASDTTSLLAMRIPKFDTGLRNYYEAQVTDQERELSVIALAVDSLNLPKPIRLVKIDVEGYELPVLRGMRKLLERDNPVLIVEGRSEEVASYLGSFGYSFEEVADSPNRVFVHS